jgi:hypothetical protein
MQGLSLDVLPDVLAICHLPPDTPLAEVPLEGRFWSATRTQDELSLVIPDDQVPKGWQAERVWRCLQVRGKLDFEVTGVLSALSAPLAFAGISIFVVSTFDTDYILVREQDLDGACEVLSEHGHEITRAGKKDIKQ